jgi:hypothetical protein
MYLLWHKLSQPWSLPHNQRILAQMEYEVILGEMGEIYQREHLVVFVFPDLQVQ